MGIVGGLRSKGGGSDGEPAFSLEFGVQAFLAATAVVSSSWSLSPDRGRGGVYSEARLCLNVAEETPLLATCCCHIRGGISGDLP